MVLGTIPDWVTYPENDWKSITPQEAGLDPAQWGRFLDNCDARGSSEDKPGQAGPQWGAAFTRGGYLVKTWGDPAFKTQTASVGKAFTWVAFGLAVEDGLVKPDDLINKTWTGSGQLSHPHKHLDQGHHKTLTWKHLLGDQDIYGHLGGFPVTNGYFWRNASPVEQQNAAEVGLFGSAGVADWAHWTGDPFYDNYSHAEPGTVRVYSSGGIWRLSQALTHLWDKDLKEVIDQRLFGPMGIPADRWHWTPGKDVFDEKNWYPHMPGYGDFIDPPYEINGHTVCGGPGWIVISALDLARFGHLIATGGIWKGERLIGSEWLRGHHGADNNQVSGESTRFSTLARVATLGIEHPLPDEVFTGPVKVGSR